MVVPPVSAARVPWEKSSAAVMPRSGIWKRVWTSMPPGMTIWPWASIVFTPPGTIRFSPICLSEGKKKIRKCESRGSSYFQVMSIFKSFIFRIFFLETGSCQNRLETSCHTKRKGKKTLSRQAVWNQSVEWAWGKTLTWWGHPPCRCQQRRTGHRSRF